MWFGPGCFYLVSASCRQEGIAPVVDRVVQVAEHARAELRVERELLASTFEVVVREAERTERSGHRIDTATESDGAGSFFVYFYIEDEFVRVIRRRLEASSNILEIAIAV